MKLMIATPAYNNQVFTHFALSLTGTVMLLESQGIKVELNFVNNVSLIMAARNRIVQQFWDSDCTHLLCIDSDIGWPPLAVLSMLQTEKQCIGGVYPSRSGKDVFYYVPTLDKKGNKIMENHLMKVERIPAGFLMFNRSVIQTLRKKFPELKFQSRSNPQDYGYCFFNTELHEGEFWGEDYYFCRKVREAGIDIWADPLIEFEHGDKKGSMGRLPNGENPYRPQEASK